ncbi:hypothetical protein LUZ60_003819 [Juncus effusus]|nr:hypothetical protein LUZ60_003819 [Juncus effusus]
MINYEGSDRISGLPDFILTDILSRLKAKEVIQTCILSKRWSKLWVFVPCLDFRYYESEAEDRENEVRETVIRENEVRENEVRDSERFENFVSSFLRFRDDATDLQSFSLSHRKSNSASARTWIDYALKHNPKKLKIVLEGHDRVHLHDIFFTCESLEDVYMDLRIKEGREKIKPDKIYLPRLKKRSFCHASIHGDYMEKLLVGCPVLESLSMFYCSLKMNNISSQTLKRLCISRCLLNKNWEPTTLTICAPNVEYLDIDVCVGYDMETRFRSLYDVRKAWLSVDFVGKYYSQLLSGLSNLENLQLRSDALEDMLKGELCDCPTFYYLKNLSLVDSCMCCLWSLVRFP